MDEEDDDWPATTSSTDTADLEDPSKNGHDYIVTAMEGNDTDGAGDSVSDAARTEQERMDAERKLRQELALLSMEQCAEHFAASHAELSALILKHVRMLDSFSFFPYTWISGLELAENHKVSRLSLLTGSLRVVLDHPIADAVYRSLWSQAGSGAKVAPRGLQMAQGIFLSRQILKIISRRRRQKFGFVVLFDARVCWTGSVVTQCFGLLDAVMVQGFLFSFGCLKYCHIVHVVVSGRFFSIVILWA